MFRSKNPWVNIFTWAILFFLIKFGIDSFTGDRSLTADLIYGQIAVGIVSSLFLAIIMSPVNPFKKRSKVHSGHTNENQIS